MAKHVKQKAEKVKLPKKPQMTRTGRKKLQSASEAVLAAEVAAKRAREHRNKIICVVANAGIPHTEISDITGLSVFTIKDIVTPIDS